MDNEQLSPVMTQLDDTEKGNSSVQPKDAAPRERINIRMVQNVFLIWLDNTISDDSADCRNIISHLRRVVNSINIFNDSDQCVQFLIEMADEKACLIISDSLGHIVVPLIHSMSQVDSIFIFSMNQEYHEQWTKDWTKIKGVFTEIVPLCDGLKQAAKDCEHNAISFSLMTTDEDLTKKNLDQLEPMFMYSQIVKEIFLKIKFEQTHFIGFINYCREVLGGNERELKNLKKFEEEYRAQTPIWWYTYECFLYPMLNRALRVMNLEVVIKMGFYIRDLHYQIDELHKQQFTGENSEKMMTVYRGQGMSKEEFEKVMKTKGGLISFNSFLSTSRSDKVSLRFARRALANANLIGVLFVMTIDPSQSTTPFASVADGGYYGSAEKEILFAMHTVFRIRDIKPRVEDSRLFQVELTLTSDNDKDLHQLTDRIRQETFPDREGWYRLGFLL